MSITDELDALAAEGRVTSVTLAGRKADGWQCYLKMGLVDSYVARAGVSPSEALAKALDALPATEAHDLKFSAAAVAARAKAEATPVAAAGIFD